MRNRDYFTKPIQSDRHLHDYGNMKLHRDDDERPSWLEFWGGFALLVLGGVAAVFAVAAIGGR